MTPLTPHNLETPFLIRVEHLDVTARGYFRPSAFVAFSSRLRMSGLLHAMTPEGMNDLLLLLTFVTPNGDCAPSLHQLAEAMRVAPGKARGRMERLMAFRWQGEPLLFHSQLESGLEFFSPRPWLAPASEDAKSEPHVTLAPPMIAAPREAVIAHTRATYARPRAQVEREIEEMMGYRRDEHGRPYRTSARMVPDPEPEAPPTAEQVELRREHDEVKEMLLQAGLQNEQAESLLAGYDTVRIRRQLMWLPHRRAKNPAGMLLAAVKDNYEAPPGLWKFPPPEVAPDEPAEDQEDALPESTVGVQDGSTDVQLEVP